MKMEDKLTAALNAIEAGHLPSEAGVMEDVMPEDEVLSFGEMFVEMVFSDDGETVIMDALSETAQWIAAVDDPDFLSKGAALIGRLSAGLGELKVLAEEKTGDALTEDNPPLADPPDTEQEEEQLEQEDEQ